MAITNHERIGKALEHGCSTALGARSRHARRPARSVASA